MGIQNTLKALADPTRREILNMLKDGPLHAGDIASRFEITDAAVSRHLSVLKDAALIRDRRQGKYIIYDINISVVEELILWMQELKGGSDV